MKPFKTHNEQIEILKSRGLNIQDEHYHQVKYFLKFENYYDIINGYKDLFLLENNSNIFKANTSFHDIYTLHQLDRHFRHLLLPKLLIFEANLKSLLSYYFSEEFQYQNFYLDSKNYHIKSDKESKKLKDLITGLSKLIKYKSEEFGPIKHHLDHYNHVPSWVLIKFMTFGQVVHMYRLLLQRLKNSIAKEFALTFNKEYSCEIELAISDLESIMRTANFFRNICAHENRLYNFHLYRKPPKMRVASILSINEQYIQYDNLFTMIAMLKLVHPKDEYNRFKASLEYSFATYQEIADSNKIFQSVPFQEIMDQMGFPKNWESLI